jgi:WD40 repeat protein
MALAPLVLSALALTGNVAFLADGNVTVVDLATRSQKVALRHAVGRVAWSGDGTLLSVGGRIVGGPRLPAAQLEWAPNGRRAAYLTRGGAVRIWSSAATRTVVPAGWGSTSVAWGRGGELALGRSVCHVPCGVPRHQEVWVWRDGSLHRIAGPLRGVQLPLVAGFAPDGRALWWSDLEGSGSIAADGLPLYANRTKLASMLPYRDYVALCGRHLALAVGRDRYATHGKRILFDGRDASRDPARSWVSPACRGSTLVAAAGRNRAERRFGLEHRSLWQLLPVRKRLTNPPPDATDESPTILPDGSIVFVRTVAGRGTVELLARGKLVPLGTIRGTANYYGHYDWARVVAVAPR